MDSPGRVNLLPCTPLALSAPFRKAGFEPQPCRRSASPMKRRKKEGA